MNKELAIQKNKIIRQFLFLNLLLFALVLFLPFILTKFMPLNWIIELFTLILLLFFVFKYLKNVKNPLFDLEQNIKVMNKKSFSLLEVNAGVIIGQLFILIFYLFTLRWSDMPIWIRFLLLIPLVGLAVIFELEYKENKKIILN